MSPELIDLKAYAASLSNGKCNFDVEVFNTAAALCPGAPFEGFEQQSVPAQSFLLEAAGTVLAWLEAKLCLKDSGWATVRKSQYGYLRQTRAITFKPEATGLQRKALIDLERAQWHGQEFHAVTEKDELLMARAVDSSG